MSRSNKIYLPVALAAAAVCVAATWRREAGASCRGRGGWQIHSKSQ